MSSKQPDKPRLWKDQLNRESVRAIAREILSVYPTSDSEAFTSMVCDDVFTSLELKDRIRHVAHHMRAFLPGDFKQATKILIKIAPNLPEFENWILTDYVELFGKKQFKQSVAALRELTRFGTSEFAIRYFVINHTEHIIPILHEWATHPNEHIRRLAAEASRPRGVWVAHVDAFKRDPKSVVQLLDILRADPSRYVQKAVANNLNDISRDNPRFAITTAKRWLSDNNPITLWIVKHGCRTLLKQGHPEALTIFGYDTRPELEVTNFRVSPRRVKIGSEFTISLKIKSSASRKQRLSIHYRIHYLKTNTNTSPKLFKLAEKNLRPAEVLSFQKQHSFKQLSTRKHNPGQHTIDLVINGVDSGSIPFQLTI